MSCRTIKSMAPLIGLVSALFCTACATTTNGAWYHQSDDGADSLYFSFIYTGRNDKLIGASINDRTSAGWDCGKLPGSASSGNDGSAPPVVPGQLVVLWLPPNPTQRCKIIVPTQATLYLSSNAGSRKGVKVNVSSSLPSALPESWLNCGSDSEVGAASVPMDTANTKSTHKPEQNADELASVIAHAKEQVERQSRKDTSNAAASILMCCYTNRDNSNKNVRKLCEPDDVRASRHS